MSSTAVTNSLLAVVAFTCTLCAATVYSRFNKNKGAESEKSERPLRFSTADQPQRFASAKAAHDVRVMNIDAVYDPQYVAGKTVLVTGANRGLGLAIAKELIDRGAKVILTSRAPFVLQGAAHCVGGIDVTDNACGEKLVQALHTQGITQIDVLVNNAGYFYGPVETLSSLNFDEELKMIDICALGPLRITAALFNAGLLKRGAKVAIISSQGGSIAWRRVQNPHGHDYGHHMSKAAANMCGMLLSQELREHGVSVSLLHPGFNKTDMTKKYEHIWEIEGAVDSAVGAKRVVHEIGLMTLSSTGAFVNCEDGLLIPW